MLAFVNLVFCFELGIQPCDAFAYCYYLVSLDFAMCMYKC